MSEQTGRLVLARIRDSAPLTCPFGYLKPRELPEPMNTLEVDRHALPPKLVPSVSVSSAWLGEGDLMQPHREIPVEGWSLRAVAMHRSRHGRPAAHSLRTLAGDDKQQPGTVPGLGFSPRHAPRSISLSRAASARSFFKRAFSFTRSRSRLASLRLMVP